MGEDWAGERWGWGNPSTASHIIIITPHVVVIEKKKRMRREKVWWMKKNIGSHRESSCRSMDKMWCASGVYGLNRKRGSSASGEETSAAAKRMMVKKKKDSFGTFLFSFFLPILFYDHHCCWWWCSSFLLFFLLKNSQVESDQSCEWRNPLSPLNFYTPLTPDWWWSSCKMMMTMMVEVQTPSHQKWFSPKTTLIIMKMIMSEFN